MGAVCAHDMGLLRRIVMVPFCVHDMEPCGARNGSRHPATGAASSSGLTGGFALPSLDPPAAPRDRRYSSIVPFTTASM